MYKAAILLYYCHRHTTTLNSLQSTYLLSCVLHATHIIVVYVLLCTVVLHVGPEETFRIDIYKLYKHKIIH